ncbi:MAG: DUF6261 family protein [Dysgonamonadaceae bacterium]|jgi:hypothetical protein|nr:DUF6261 family protein [Dysgonamonadaceae bacterium]
MKIKIRKPELGRYKNADHVEYNEESYGTCIRYESEIDEQILLEAYHYAIEQEVNVYHWIRKGEFTEQKEKTDKKRDSIYRGMCGIVRANLKNFNPVVRNYATHVLDLINNYGNITRNGYDAETSAIDSLVNRLEGSKYADAVEALEISGWIQELSDLNALFKTYARDTLKENVKKPDITMKKARKITDLALRAIIEKITAKINTECPCDFTEFIREFNAATDHYNIIVHEHYGRLHAKIDINPANIADIAVQQYTGKPIFIIPELTLAVKERDESVKIVELIFSEDFSVTYKNNINCGTAHIIITGIGKYTGEINATFNIN